METTVFSLETELRVKKIKNIRPKLEALVIQIDAVSTNAEIDSWVGLFKSLVEDI